MDDLKKAAIMLLGMGEETAAEVLKHMHPKQVEKIVKAINELKNVSPAQLDDVANDFYNVSKNQTGIGVDSGEFMRGTLINALGEKNASLIIDRSLTDDGQEYGLELLKWQDASTVAAFLRDEHPQIIAVILTYLDSEHAAEVLSELPDELRLHIIHRMASLKSISPQALQELNRVIEDSAKDVRSFKTLPVRGEKVVANIINHMNNDVESKVIEGINQLDKGLGEKIQDLIFPFEKLANMDSRSLQTLLRDIANDELVLALKGVDDAVKQAFFDNMSKRAAELLNDDLEAQGPVQLNKVLTAQKNIISLAQKKAKDGELVLGSTGGDDIVS
jgi:flagellar motor switch protein FliG